LGTIPTRRKLAALIDSNVFVRTRSLSLPRLIVSILHLAGGGKTEGVDIEMGRFFIQARRSDLWPKQTRSAGRSAFSQARGKLPWQVFQRMLADVVALAYEWWPKSKDYQWCGLNVFAIDGSPYKLPATAALRNTFDPNSGLGNPGKGHYPQCLVSTLYDVFRRIPIARTIVPTNGSERAEAMAMAPLIPPGALVIFDRGYPGFELFFDLCARQSLFLFRCSAKSLTFSEVYTFIQSGKAEGVINITPSRTFLATLPLQDRHSVKPIQLRVIRMDHPDGSVSALVTNLMDPSEYECDAIADLYRRRYSIEVQYRDEKVIQEIEKFHGQTENSIRQELLAVAIMTTIAKILTATVAHEENMKGCVPQAKNAIIVLANDAAVLVPHDPHKAFEIFQEILGELRRIRYYFPKNPRPPYPRINKDSVNKWKIRRQKNPLPATAFAQ
jgi:hypothetical protein